MEKREKEGFTLIELLIAMAIALVIIASLATTFLSQQRAYDVQQEVTAMTQTARAAMDMMARELRMAGYNPTGTMQNTDPSAAAFVGIPYDATQLMIVADLNNDGATDGSSEQVTYKYYNTTEYPKQVKRRTGGGYFQPFAENIENFSFEYYDADGNPTTTTSDIRIIKITIQSRTEKEDPYYIHPDLNNGHRTFELVTDVTPPNLGFERNP